MPSHFAIKRWFSTIGSFVSSLLFVCLLSGCVSNIVQGERLLKEGSYEEAIAVYEKLQKSEPANPRVVRGLRVARINWISRRLIEVRAFRLAGNRDGALDALADLLNKEEKWQVFPTGVVAFTQAEEIDESSRFARFEIQKAIDGKYPLKALALFQKHESVLRSQKPEAKLALENRLRAVGQESCGTLKDSLVNTDLFYARFVDRFCKTFQAAGPHLPSHERLARKTFFSGARLASQVVAGDDRLQSALAEAFDDRLKKTPWYDPAGSLQLRLTARGSYAYSSIQQNIQLTHHYEVQIPYTVTRVVPKEKREPAKEKDKLVAALEVTSAVFSVLGSIGSAASPSPRERDNGDGTVTIEETRYRAEPRSYQYPAISHLQQARLALTLTGSALHRSLQLEFDETKRNSTTEHHQSDPARGLYPKAPSMIPEHDWMKEFAAESARQLEQELRSLWQSEYCPGSSSGTVVTNESVQRCMALGTEAVPTRVDRWYVETVGMNAKEAHQALSTGFGADSLAL